MNEDKILEVHEAIYDEVETYPNCTVQLLRNSVTGENRFGEPTRWKEYRIA